MAAIVGAQSGTMPYTPNGSLPAAFRIGNTASAVNLAAATNATITIPTDAAGVAYKCIQVNSSNPCWWNFNSDSTAATIGGANCFLQGGNESYPVVVPPGATKVSVIFSTGQGPGDVCVTGLF